MPELKIENFLESQKDQDDQEYSIQIQKSHFTWGLASVDEDSKEDKEKESKKDKDTKQEKPKKKCCFGSKAKKITQKEDEKETKEETVSIDQLVVLKDIDFKIKRGEFVCIIGDVGAGKSSLLSSIIGDLIPVSPS
jgi:ABC-type molybdenum transport system ATPase subunit/photorepair protein PhrA